MSFYYGGEGNDILPEGGVGNDLTDDNISGYGGDDQLFGGAGNDTLKGGGGNDTLDGGADIDTLKGGGGDDTMMGGAGNDTLISQAGSDTLDGGEGDDEYRVTSKDEGTADTYQDTGTGGHDVIDATRVTELMLGSDFDASSGIEEILGDAEDPLYIVGDGSAVNWDFTGIDLTNVAQITGSGEGDEILGSGGDDKIKGGGGNDGLGGGDGEDTLIGGGGDDTLDGGDGDDSLKGGGYADDIHGGEGNDLIVGGTGNDTLDGGEGDDEYRLLEGEVYDGDSITDTGVYGTDALDAGRVAELVLGDAFDASTTGLEEIWGDDEDGTEIVGSDNGVDWDFGGLTMTDITQINGGGGNDSILGSDGDDKVKSLDGDDYVNGGAGNDNLTGGAGADHLEGGDGDDVLKGGGGDDMLAGGAGNDNLKGGGGNDTLMYDADDGNVDGQDGNGDTLSLDGLTGVTLDLSGAAGVTLKNIEVIDLGNGGNTLSLDKVSVKDLSETVNVLTVNGGATDSIHTTDEWTQVEDEGSYSVYINGTGVYLRVLTGVNVDFLNTVADDAPVLDVNTGANVNEGGTLVITAEMLGAADVDSAADAIVFKVTELPSHGSVLLDGVALLVNGTFTQADLEAGLVTYENAGDDGVLDGFSFTLSDGGNNDALSGGFSIDINATIEGANDANDAIVGGAGNDTLYGGTGNDLVGANGNDTLTGNGGDDSLFGGGGNDTLNGNAGDDALSGGDHSDTLYGGDGVDSLDGGAGDDELWGEAGDDVMHGGDDGDVLIGGFGNDVMYGDAGSDFLAGDTGADTLKGGDGDDTYSLHDLDDTIVENVGEGTDRVQIGTDTAGMPGGTLVLAANVEDAELFGSSDFDVTGNDLDNHLDGESFATGGDNVLDGAGGNDILDGGAGNDTLIGGAGNDTLNGGADDDLLVGGAGDDGINGGDGIDTVDYSAMATAVTVNLTGGTATGEGADTLSGIEVVIGGAGGDTLLGNAEDNTISGGAGVDVIDGAGGNDVLDGGSENDSVFGFAGDDVLSGGTGDDNLAGGDGSDVLNGGDGDDVLTDSGTVLFDEEDQIYGGAGNDTLNGGNGNDDLFGGTGDDEFVFSTVIATTTESIGDFEGAGVAGGDVIALDNAAFAGLGGDGPLSTAEFESGAGLTAATTADTRLFYNTTDGSLYYDADGNGIGSMAVKITTITGSPDDLDENDFLII